MTLIKENNFQSGIFFVYGLHAGHLSVEMSVNPGVVCLGIIKNDRFPWIGNLFYICDQPARVHL